MATLPFIIFMLAEAYIYINNSWGCLPKLQMFWWYLLQWLKKYGIMLSLAQSIINFYHIVVVFFN